MRLFALWRAGNSRLGFVADHAEFPWRLPRTSHHTFVGGLARVYSEFGPWDVHAGLAAGPAYSPAGDGCSAAPVVFAAQPGVGVDLWIDPRWAIGITGAYVIPIAGSFRTCDAGGPAKADEAQQVLGVGSVALEISWGAGPAHRP